MTVKGWFNNNSTPAFKKNNKKHQQQQHPPITTITAPLPPFSTPPPPYSHALSPSLPSSSSSASCNISSPSSPLASTAPSTLLPSFQINKKSPLRHTIMQQPQQQPPQQHHTYSFTSRNNDDSTSPKSPRPYTLNVLPTTTTFSSNPSSCSAFRASPSPSPAPIDDNVFIRMTMNPRESVPRLPTEFHIRPSTPPSSSHIKNSTATYSNSSNFSNLEKALPAPPKRATKTKTTAAALLKFNDLKTRLRTHSFSSSTFSFPTPSTSPSPQLSSVLSLVPSPHKTPSSSSTVSTTPESVAQEYARTIKTLWKMIEDEEQAYRLVEASHSLSGSIPTIADISPGTGGVVNRPPYVGTALRWPSLPLLMTVPPIQEEEETSPSTTTSPTRSPFSPRPSSGPRRRNHPVSLATLNTTPLHTKPTTTTTTATLVCSSTNEMDHTVADLELSPVGFSDASEEEYSSENDSEAEEERVVVHIAQKVSMYRGRSFSWSQPA